MGEYVFNIPLIAIRMGGAHVVLGVQWLHSLGKMAFNFQSFHEIFMGRKWIRVKWYHKKTKQGDNL